jgi:RND superfamily putative drug exporter
MLIFGDANWKLPVRIDRLLPHLQVEGATARAAAARGQAEPVPEPAPS